MDNNDSISIQFVALDVALEKNNDVDALQVCMDIELTRSMNCLTFLL